MLSKKQTEEVFRILASQPAHVELNYLNHYQFLVAVVLSAHTSDESVNKATKILFEEVKTPEEMIEMGLDTLTFRLRTLLFYRNKSKYVIELSKILVDKFHSQVPNKLEALESLPGVGRKTANVVLNELFDQPVFPVDRHVFRVCNRIGFTAREGENNKDPLETESVLKKIVPKEYARYAANAMVLLGRYTCRPTKPKCSKCPVNQFCQYKDKYWDTEKDDIKKAAKKTGIKKQE